MLNFLTKNRKNVKFFNTRKIEADIENTRVECIFENFAYISIISSNVLSNILILLSNFYLTNYLKNGILIISNKRRNKWM